jgi:Tol biopolymer transport system component
MTHGRHRILTALAVSLLLVPVVTETQGSGEVALRVAMETETVKGDLRAAIEQYKIIAAGRDRALAAKALVRMAECYQKLGDTEAQKIYEQVLRDFADQRDAAAEARTRLTSLQPLPRTEANHVARQIANGNELGADFMPSLDGRHVSFIDDTGNVSLRDLVSGTNRRLTHTADWKNEYANVPVISPDGRQVAYNWYVHEKSQAEIRVVPTVGDQPVPKVVLRGPLGEATYMIAWMPDGKQLQVVRARSDRTSQIGTVTIQDGTFRSLKSLEWRVPNALSLSPDGRYLAYDVPAGEAGSPRDVVVLATDGSQETTAVKNPANDSFPQWSPDGSQLLFLSDRTGRNSLWMVPIQNGRALGAATSIKADVGPISLRRLTNSGTLLYFEPRPGGPNIQLAELDGMRATKPPAAMTERVINQNFGPVWSHNGQQLAYYSFLQISADTRSGVLVIRSTSTGEERTVPLPTRVSSRFGAGPKWFPDTRSMLVESGDAEGPGFGFYRLALDTGNTELLARVPREVSSYDLSPDGRTIFYVLNRDDGQRMMRFDIESRLDTELRDVVFPAGREIVSMAVSPDGLQLATTLIGGFVEVMPSAGGASRKVFSPPEPEMGTGALRQGLSWTPDQRSLLFVRGDASLWTVPALGGEAVKVGTERVKSPGLHPDGKRLVFSGPGRPDASGVGGPFTRKVMALDGILPGSVAKR